MVRLLNILVLVKELDSDYLILPIILTGSTASMYSKATVYSYTLINSGGFVISFIDINFIILY